MDDWLRTELLRIWHRVVWSWQGFWAAWATEKSFRQWVMVNLASATLAMVIDLTAGERALILALGLLILAAELGNSAIEEAVDYISTEPDPRARKAKDVGSAMVAVTAFAGGVAWLVILIG
jgi:diacylglycerol kinase (ATP)